MNGLTKLIIGRIMQDVKFFECIDRRDLLVQIGNRFWWIFHGNVQEVSISELHDPRGGVRLPDIVITTEELMQACKVEE